jgi:hypothetical protein
MSAAALPETMLCAALQQLSAHHGARCRTGLRCADMLRTASEPGTIRLLLAYRRCSSSKLLRCCWSVGWQANDPDPRSELPSSKRKHEKLGYLKAHRPDSSTDCKDGLAGSTSGRSCHVAKPAKANVKSLRGTRSFPRNACIPLQQIYTALCTALENATGQSG